MNAKSEFAPGRSERWRHPEPRQPAWAAGRQQQAAGKGQNIPRTDAFRGHHENSDFTAPWPSRALVTVGLSIQQLPVIHDPLR